jgi:hypothetical protein
VKLPRSDCAWLTHYRMLWVTATGLHFPRLIELRSSRTPSSLTRVASTPRRETTMPTHQRATSFALTSHPSVPTLVTPSPDPWPFGTAGPRSMEPVIPDPSPIGSTENQLEAGMHYRNPQTEFGYELHETYAARQSTSNPRSGYCLPAPSILLHPHGAGVPRRSSEPQYVERTDQPIWTITNPSIESSRSTPDLSVGRRMVLD